MSEDHTSGNISDVIVLMLLDWDFNVDNYMPFIVIWNILLFLLVFSLHIRIW